jgi:HSP20 family protein
MNVLSWDSWDDRAAHQDWMSRIGEGFYGCSQAQLAPGAWTPAVDIYSTGDRELVLKADLPDMKKSDIEVTVEGNTLTLRGERKLDAEVAKEQFHRIERSFGAFSRTFALPATVNPGKVTAAYNAGILTVRLPLREETKPTHIRVQVAA